MIYPTDDPGRDFDRWDAYMTKLEDELPTCDHCGGKIRDDRYCDMDGYKVCLECLERDFMKAVEI